MIRLKSLLTEDAQFNANEAQKWAKSVTYNFIYEQAGRMKIQYVSEGEVRTYFGDVERPGTKVITTRDGLEHEAYVPHGFGWLLEGKNLLKGQFVNGEKHGYFTVKFENGDTYNGNITNHDFNGHGVYTWADGGNYKGQFVDDRFEGYGVRKYKNGNVYKGNWKNDMRNGYGVLTYPDGGVEKGEWLNDDLAKRKATADAANSSSSTSTNTSGTATTTPAGGTTGTATGDWFRHPTDNVYVYQQRQGVWWAKNINNNKEFDISKNPAYKSTIDNLNSAQQTKKLVKV